tara:strand:+ start:261 stop:911 length:651 start_codon:yes stop_codon:yes gene_type:complete
MGVLHHFVVCRDYIDDRYSSDKMVTSGLDNVIDILRVDGEFANREDMFNYIYEKSNLAFRRSFIDDKFPNFNAVDEVKLRIVLRRYKNKIDEMSCARWTDARGWRVVATGASFDSNTIDCSTKRAQFNMKGTQTLPNMSRMPPSLSRRIEQTTLTVLTIQVLSSGDVDEVSVDESSGDKSFDSWVVSIVRSWCFKPQKTTYRGRSVGFTIRKSNGG